MPNIIRLLELVSFFSSLGYGTLMTRESPDGKFALYEKDDFERFRLPLHSYYYLDELGQGVMLKFPVKTKLSFVNKQFVRDC